MWTSRKRSCRPIEPAAAIEPSDDQRAQARELAADISDPDLRRAAERAIAAGLARDS